MSPRDVFRFFQVMSKELNTPKVIHCPADLMRPPSIGDFKFTNNLVVSYFVGPNASLLFPSMPLCGDRNVFGPATSAKANNGFGNSTVDGSGARVVFGTNLSTNDPLRVGWTKQMHKLNGNVLMADGSVRQLSSRRLVQTLNESGDTNLPANVLLFP